MRAYAYIVYYTSFYGLLFRQTFYSWGCDATYIDVYGLVLVGVSASLDLCLLLSHLARRFGGCFAFFRPLLALDIGLVLGYLPTAAAPLSFACLLWDESKDFGSHPFVSPLLPCLCLSLGGLLVTSNSIPTILKLSLSQECTESKNWLVLELRRETWRKPRAEQFQFSSVFHLPYLLRWISCLVSKLSFEIID